MREEQEIYHDIKSNSETKPIVSKNISPFGKIAAMRTVYLVFQLHLLKYIIFQKMYGFVRPNEALSWIQSNRSNLRQHKCVQYPFHPKDIALEFINTPVLFRSRFNT